MNNISDKEAMRKQFEQVMAEKLNVWNISNVPTFQIDEATGVYVKIYVGAAWAAWQAAYESCLSEFEQVTTYNYYLDSERLLDEMVKDLKKLPRKTPLFTRKG